MFFYIYIERDIYIYILETMWPRVFEVPLRNGVVTEKNRERERNRRDSVWIWPSTDSAFRWAWNDEERMETVRITIFLADRFFFFLFFSSWYFLPSQRSARYRRWTLQLDDGDRMFVMGYCVRWRLRSTCMWFNVYNWTVKRVENDDYGRLRKNCRSRIYKVEVLIPVGLKVFTILLK